MDDNLDVSAWYSIYLADNGPGIDDYLQRGRSYEQVSMEALTGEYMLTLRDAAEDMDSAVLHKRIIDMDAEFALRRQRPPAEQITDLQATMADRLKAKLDEVMADPEARLIMVEMIERQAREARDAATGRKS